jgi:hypothetical protein
MNWMSEVRRRKAEVRRRKSEGGLPRAELGADRMVLGGTGALPNGVKLRKQIYHGDTATRRKAMKSDDFGENDWSD